MVQACVQRMSENSQKHMWGVSNATPCTCLAWLCDSACTAGQHGVDCPKVRLSKQARTLQLCGRAWEGAFPSNDSRAI